MHDAVNVVGVKRKEGEETGRDAFGELAAQAIVLECVLCVAAYV